MPQPGFNIQDLVSAPLDYEGGVKTSAERKLLGPHFDELVSGLQSMRAGRFNPDTNPGFTAYYPGEGATGVFHDSGAFARDAHQRRLASAQAENEAPSIVDLNRALGYPIRPIEGR